MTDSLTDPNTTIYPKTPGVLAGFDSAVLTQDPTDLSKVGWSREQLVEYILNLYEKIGPEGMRSVRNTMVAHITNYNNPHKDDILAYADHFMSTLVADIVPGTTPGTYPTYTLSADLELVQDLLALSVSRASPVLMISRQGMLVSVPNDTIASDWSYGVAQIPCWPEVTSYRTTHQFRVGTTEILRNTSVATTPIAGLITPFADTTYTTLLEKAGAGPFGFDMALKAPVVGPQMVSAFLKPGSRGGFVAFTVSGLENSTVLVDLTTGEVVSQTPSVALGGAVLLPNGWVRAGILFNNTDTTDKTVEIRHYLTSTETSRTGISNTPIFSVCILQQTNSRGLAPVFPDGQTTLAPTTITIPQSSSTFPKTTQMALVSTVIPGALDTLSEPVLVGSGAQIKNLGTALEVGCLVGNTPSFTNPLDPTDPFVSAAFSQDSTKFKVKFSGQDAVEHFGDYSLIAAVSQLQIGPFSGGLYEVVLYAVSDLQKDLEFLTDG